MKVPTNRAVLLEPAQLFDALHRLRLGIGNSASTVCEVFTAGGAFSVKTNTGDFKAPADGELWPPVTMRMRQLKLLAKIYRTSKAPLVFERSDHQIKIGPTTFPL